MSNKLVMATGILWIVLEIRAGKKRHVSDHSSSPADDVKNERSEEALGKLDRLIHLGIDRATEPFVLGFDIVMEPEDLHVAQCDQQARQENEDEREWYDKGLLHAVIDAC